MRGTAYLIFPAAALFLALAAWTGSALLACGSAPETVTAEYIRSVEEVTLGGTVVRSETVVTAPPDARLDCRTGQRVTGGSVLGKSGEGCVYAPCAGIFSSYCDGLESIQPNAAEQTPAPCENAVGKIVHGGWFFVSNSTKFDKFYVGQSVTLLLPEECPATVVSTSFDKVVFRCRQCLDAVINARGLTVTVRIGTQSGVRLPKNAVHSDENGEFVYVLRAKAAVRCSVETLATDDDSSLVRGAELRQGMEIITNK